MTVTPLHGRPIPQRPRLGVLLGASSDTEADEFEATAAAVLASLAEPVEPSRGFRDALFARIDEAGPTAGGSGRVGGSGGSRSAGTAAAVPAPPALPGAPVRRLHPARRVLIGVAGAAAAVALFASGVAVTSQLQHPGGSTSASSTLADITAAPDSARTTATFAHGTARATVVSSAALGRAVAVVEGAPALAADRHYELWLIRDGHATAAGTFEAGSPSSTVTLTGRFRAGDVVAATVEGQPTPSAPTTPPVFEVTA